MLNETLLNQISDTGELLGLDAAVIEKDYYITQVIHKLTDVENEYFRLVFCGSTWTSTNASIQTHLHPSCYGESRCSRNRRTLIER